MNSKIYKRIRLETEYILKENLTVREIAKKITAQFSKHEFRAVFLCNFLGKAKH